MTIDALTGAYQQMAFVETFIDASGLIRVQDSFRLTPSFGAVYYQTVDLGFPDVRSSVQDLPQADGTYDETRYLGARTVTITGTVLQDAFGTDPQDGAWDPSIGWNSASWFCRYLAGWASPARRFRFYFTDDSGVSRFMDVRGDSFSAPIDKTANDYRDFQIGLINPSGKVYAFTANPSLTLDGRNLQLIRQSSVDLPGRTYPMVYPRTYPLITGSTAVTYNGSVSNGFIAHIYTTGQAMTDPRLTVTGPDGVAQSIGISGYTIPANSVVTFDAIERTISVTTPTESNKSLDEYKTAPLQWPVLKPGLTLGQNSGHNSIGLSIGTGSPSAYAEIIYNDADLQ